MVHYGLNKVKLASEVQYSFTVISIFSHIFEHCDISKKSTIFLTTRYINIENDISIFSIHY